MCVLNRYDAVNPLLHIVVQEQHLTKFRFCNKKRLWKNYYEHPHLRVGIGENSLSLDISTKSTGNGIYTKKGYYKNYNKRVTHEAAATFFCQTIKTGTNTFQILVNFFQRGGLWSTSAWIRELLIKSTENDTSVSVTQECSRVYTLLYIITIF